MSEIPNAQIIDLLPRIQEKRRPQASAIISDETEIHGGVRGAVERALPREIGPDTQIYTLILEREGGVWVATIFEQSSIRNSSANLSEACAATQADLLLQIADGLEKHTQIRCPRHFKFDDARQVSVEENSGFTNIPHLTRRIAFTHKSNFNRNWYIATLRGVAADVKSMSRRELIKSIDFVPEENDGGPPKTAA